MVHSIFNRFFAHARKRISLDDYIALYLSQISSGARQTDRGSNYSPATVKSVRYSLGRFTAFQREVRREYDFRHVDMAFYYEYTAFLKRKGLSINSVGKCIRDLKVILRAADCAALGPRHEQARDIFLVGVWTAQRISDYNHIRREDLQNRSTTNAAALQGKALLFVKDYAGAKAALKKVIDSGKYALVPGAKYADLFHVEGDANEGAKYVNMIRERAGLTPLATVTMDDLKKEKSYELWLEGSRWLDLLRWGDTKRVEQAGQAVPKLFDKVFRAPKAGESVVWENGTEANSRFYTVATHEAIDAKYTVGFKAGKHEFFPYPTSVMSKNPNIVQNPGWE